MQDHARRPFDSQSTFGDERPRQKGRCRRFSELGRQGVNGRVDALALFVELIEGFRYRRRAGLTRENGLSREREDRSGERESDRAPDRALNVHDADDNVRNVTRSVVVSGIGVVSAFGTTHEEFRDALLDGRSAIAPVANFSTVGCRSTLAAEITGFEPTAWVPTLR